MAGPSAVRPLSWAQFQVVAHERVADSKLFADSLAGTDAGLAPALLQALLPRVACVAQWPLRFVIHLARRGPIKVNARHEHRAWVVSLTAEHCATHQWLAGQQQALQQRLTRRLGQPVNVRLHQGWQG